MYYVLISNIGIYLETCQLLAALLYMEIVKKYKIIIDSKAQLLSTFSKCQVLVFATQKCLPICCQKKKIFFLDLLNPRPTIHMECSDLDFIPEINTSQGLMQCFAMNCSTEIDSFE